ncbi:MAG: phage major capsid protein [Pseudomonadota bacterium]|nr:phage major capsid protein [Pseudomonadota bacterium]
MHNVVMPAAPRLETKGAPALERKDAPQLELKDVFAKHVEVIEQKIADQGLSVKQVQATLVDLEQRLDSRTPFGGGSAAPPSWGSQFIEAKGSELATMETSRAPAVMEIKATITSATTDAAGSAGSLAIPERVQGVDMLQRRLTIRNLLTVAPAQAGSVEYAEQTGRTNNAALVAEGAQKPESDLQFALKTVPMRVIAHWMKASRQILDDAPQLRTLIDVELRYGLALVEEQQLLYGNGTGQNLLGMIPQATDFAPAFTVADETPIDRLGLAILQVALTDNQPDGIVLHPADWWRLRLLKDGDGNYIFGPPGTVVAPSLFGLPIVPTQAMNAGEFLVGAFQPQTLYDRWTARVETGFAGDDFTRNLVTVLGEERIGFAAKRPEALVNGTFEDPAP